MRGVSSWTLIPLRMTFALLTLFVVMAVTKRFWTTDPTAWRRGVPLGIINMAIPMVFMTLAFEDLPVSLGGLLIALIPLATISAAHFLVEGERFQIRTLPGLLVALAGTALLVGVGGESATGVGHLWRGVALMMTGVLIAGIGGALSRRFALETPSSDLVLPQFTVNTFVVAVILPLFFDFEPSTVDTTSWWLIAAIGAFGTTLTFSSFLIAAGMNPASRLGLISYAIPPLSVILAVIFLDESLTPAIIAGAALILTGVVLAERNTTHVPGPGVVTAR